MAYYGGHVQVHPKEYMVYWGWGESGAFPSSQKCSSETLTEGSITATLGCDPDGAGKYMADFVQQMGGTGWANVSTQYYQVDSSGNTQYVSNDKEVLAGIWADDSNTSPRSPRRRRATPRARPTPTRTWPQEAARAAAHFGVKGAGLVDANFIIIQPPAYSDPNALNSGYCAFHDYTLRRRAGELLLRPAKYVQQGLSYTEHAVLAGDQLGGINVCGAERRQYDASNRASASSTASRSSSVTRSRRRSPIPAPRARWGAA